MNGKPVPVRIDIVFDTICPWCYIGKRRLEQAMRLRPEVPVVARWRPFLLNPAMPAEGIDRAIYLAEKFGGEGRVRRTYGAIGEAGQSVDIDFAFDRIARTPNTVNSHRLVRFADRHGRADAAVEALFLDYFINGRNIGEIDTLVRIGGHLGLDGGALRAYLESDDEVALIHDENSRAHRLGIGGVPSFIFEDRFVISGAQEAAVLARVLDAAALQDPAEGF